VEWLCAHEIEPIIFYFNPNIYPQEEYEIRKAESKRHAESLGIQWIDGDVGCQMLDVGCQMSVVSSQWSASHAEWLEAMRGLENEPERGSRCARCFYYRMLATAKKAQELGIPFFATTLASSRWKNLEQINAAGEKAAKDVGCQMLDVHFWAQNWRKDGLQERRNALLKEYAFYNQQYCGCEFSMRSTK
jgi:predicted adenine nucleotide alpha hydrolase (AANH) superfamily ATPase